MEHIYQGFIERRSIYKVGKNIPVSDETVVNFIKNTTKLVPDAFNMRSQRVVTAFGEWQEKLWDTVYDCFNGKVEREKIDGFKKAHGTILYFYDTDIVKQKQDQFPLYAENFPIWAQQSNGMLQFSIWSGLRELNIGANIQHYNPVIDTAVKELFSLPESYKLIAQMPFGEILGQPDKKDEENIDQRVLIFE